MKHEITIEHGIPMPEGRWQSDSDLGRLRTALRSMQVGDSFVWTPDDKHPYLAAKQVGCRVRTEKLKKGGWRVWLREASK